jgi:threonine synthase
LIDALRELWRQGFYVEPTAAVGAAAFVAAVRAGRSIPDGDIVVYLTGFGLKATETIAGLID